MCLGFQLHLAALASLKSDILDLSNRLQFLTQERDQLEKALSKSEIERMKIEKRIEEESQLHEEQLTELHSVIAELTRKVQHQRSMVIREEEDVSGVYRMFVKILLVSRDRVFFERQRFDLLVVV